MYCRSWRNHKRYSTVSRQEACTATSTKRSLTGLCVMSSSGVSRLLLSLKQRWRTLKVGICLPSLVSTHRHSFRSLAPTAGDGEQLEVWMLLWISQLCIMGWRRRTHWILSALFEEESEWYVFHFVSFLSLQFPASHRNPFHGSLQYQSTTSRWHV